MLKAALDSEPAKCDLLGEHSFHLPESLPEEVTLTPYESAENNSGDRKVGFILKIKLTPCHCIPLIFSSTVYFSLISQFLDHETVQQFVVKQ